MTGDEIRHALRRVTELEHIHPEQRTETEERFLYTWHRWLNKHPEWTRT
jgi:hypothetical protein